MSRTHDVSRTRRLIIAIDFGTTYSAVSYALHDWDSIQQPSTKALNETKVRSVLFDESKDEIKTQVAWHAGDQDYVWGNEVDVRIRHKEIPEKDRIVMLKLGLDKSDATKEIRSKQDEQLSRIPPAFWGDNNDWRRPLIEDLISLYLGRLYAFAKEKITHNYGTIAGARIFSTTDIQCVICVPAMWTPEMNQVMVAAAQQAAIPNPDIVSESEAAAAFVMFERQRQAPTFLERAFGMFESTTPNVSSSRWYPR